MFSIFKGRKGREAHMGEDNSMYFNDELQRWVVRGEEDKVVDDSVPPPPVASATTATTTAPLDAGNPASRYVAAGDFGRNAAPPGETVKSFLTPPKLTNAAPLTGGFFVPAATQTKSETALSDPSSPRAAERYKGYCIPKFTKPEGFLGTQEAYEAAELEKFKKKIDRKESRKTSLSPSTPPSQTPENGFTPMPTAVGGGAKLDNSWLAGNGESQALFQGENGNDRDLIDEAFGLSSSPVAISEPLPTETPQNHAQEGEPVALYPVEPDVKSEPGHLVGASWMQSEVEGNGTVDWYKAQGMEEAPVDFDSWVDPNQTQALDPVSQTQYMSPEPQATEGGDLTEAEYPGAVRDSDDPYDTAWLMKKGWTDPKICQEITAWLYQSYQDSWRTWHRSESFWEEFWNWYYDEGYDVIHPKQPSAISTYQNNEATHIGTEDEMAAAFFNSEVGDELNKGAETHFSRDLLDEETIQAATEPASEMAAVEAPVSEEFVPLDDEEIWKIPEDEAEEASPEVVPVLETEAVDHSNAPKEELTFRPVSTGQESTTTKLSPWEDEFLFSLPDPWTAVPSSEEDTDDGRLPFAVFNHEGMFQFLQKLNGLLTELATNNATELSAKASQFQHQVLELMKAVEMSRSPGHEVKDMGVAEEEALRQELEIKGSEMTALEKQLMEREVEWNNQLAVAQQESTELKRAHDAMAISLKEQETRMQELSVQLEESEAELESHKSQMADWLADLKTKDATIDSLREDVSAKEAAVEALQEQLEKAEGEMEQLKNEIHTLKQCPSTDYPSEATSELRQQVMTLQKKLMHQEKTVEEKEQEITRLMDSSQGTELSANNNEIPGMDDWMEELADKDAEISQMRQTLFNKDTQISSLEAALQQKTADYQALSQQEQPNEGHPELERKLHRLEQEIDEKEAELKQCRALLESLPTKDSLISKLTSVLGEKDEELMELCRKIQESRQMETDLIGQLSAKDIDLENVVQSLLFSQKQVSRLCSYCSDLGGDPHQLLTSLQVVE